MSTRIYAAEGIQSFFSRFKGQVANPSTLVNRAIERYDYLLSQNLPTFTVEEWGIIFDLIAERPSIHVKQIQTLGKSLAQDLYVHETLVSKWEIDTEVMAEKLLTLNTSETVAMLDAAERYLITNVFEGVGLPVKSAVLQ